MLTINKVLRILSYVSVVSPIPFAFAEKSGTGFLGVCESFLIGACAVLLSAPLSAEVLSEGWRSIIAPFVCYITVLLCSSFACSPLIPRFLILSILVLLIFLRTRHLDWIRDSYASSFLCWCVLERESRLLLCSFLLAASFLGTLLPDKIAVHIVYACLLLGCYAALLYRSLRGRSLVFPRKTEDSCMESEFWKTHPKASKGEIDNVYRRVLSVMELEKPYLDEEFSINDLVRKVYSNKSYISKAINIHSGMNFRSFVNGYRVRYSTSLMRSNKELKVADISAMSGFHSDVSFNMAFKLAYGRTPGEYYQELKAEELQHLSKKQAQGLSDESERPAQDE